MPFQNKSLQRHVSLTSIPRPGSLLNIFDTLSALALCNINPISHNYILSTLSDVKDPRVIDSLHFLPVDATPAQRRGRIRV